VSKPSSARILLALAATARSDQDVHRLRSHVGELHLATVQALAEQPKRPLTLEAPPEFVEADGLIRTDTSRIRSVGPLDRAGGTTPPWAEPPRIFAIVPGLRTAVVTQLERIASDTEHPRSIAPTAALATVAAGAATERDVELIARWIGNALAHPDGPKRCRHMADAAAMVPASDRMVVAHAVANNGKSAFEAVNAHIARQQTIARGTPTAGR